MKLESLRKDFPLLPEGGNKKSIIYFDNACQTLRPQSVISAVNSYYTTQSSCGGRSMHQLAASVTRDVDSSRQEMAKFLGARKKEEIVFTRNATEGINLVAHSLTFNRGDTVIIGGKEHNSNLVPWQVLARQRGIDLRVVAFHDDNTWDMPAFERALSTGRPRLVSLGWTSNLDGYTIPAEEIIQRAHRAGSLVMLDAAQTVPHRRVNVKGLDVDFLALSGHKMLGPSGMGVLYGKFALLESLEPFITGGDTVTGTTYADHEFLPPPARFEAGLQDYAGIIGMQAAARYLQSVGFEAIQKHESMLNAYVSREIAGIEGLHIIGPRDASLRSGIVSFYIDSVDSHRIALMLDQMANIEVRSGQHCVHSWFNAHGILNCVRPSFYFYNTLAECEQFVENLRKIRKVL